MRQSVIFYRRLGSHRGVYCHRWIEWWPWSAARFHLNEKSRSLSDDFISLFKLFVLAFKLFGAFFVTLHLHWGRNSLIDMFFMPWSYGFRRAANLRRDGWNSWLCRRIVACCFIQHANDAFLNLGGCSFVFSLSYSLRMLNLTQYWDGSRMSVPKSL